MKLKVSLFYKFIYTLILILFSFISLKKYEKSKIKLTKQMYNLIKKINNFIYICTKGILIEDIKLSYENPKISAIITLFNSEKTIKTAIRSIQNQNEKDIEIIIIEDCSNDNSLREIEKLKKEDSRIKIIKNKKNRGALFSKSIGALNSIGKYIFFLDSDDLFINKNLFEICYNHSEKGIDIIEFSGFASEQKYLKTNKIPIVPLYLRFKQNNELILQPRLSKFIYQKNGNKIIRLIDGFLCGKCIKSKIYKKTLRSIGNWIFKKKVNYGEDRIVNFALFKTAHSFKFILEYGLIYYYKNPSSITNKLHYVEKCHDELINIMSLFNFSKKSYEIDVVLYEIDFRWKWLIEPGLNEKNKKFLINLLTQILKCHYINYEDKNKIKSYLALIKI